MKSSVLDDITVALKAGEKRRVRALRLIASEIKQKEIDGRIELDESGFISVLEKMSKQRRESIKQFQDAQRDDLVAQEEFELEIISQYLPEPLSDAEVEALITAKISESGASSARDMGKVIGLIKAQAQGRVDMGKVSQLVKQKLSETSG